MELLQNMLQDYSDDYLVDLYINHRDDYTEDALNLIRGEIRKRRIDIESLSSPSDKKASGILHFDSADFTAVEHIFNQIDIELAAAILKDNKIPFYVDNPHSDDVLPIESMADRQFTIHVHNSMIKVAYSLLEEHFEINEGMYRLKKMGIKEQLKAFSFTGLHLSEKEALEKVTVVLTPQEKSTVSEYGNRILRDSDAIEEKQDRVIFYYDSIEPLIAHLASSNEEVALTKTELVTILEILQIFCDEDKFPQFLDETISTLLSFFMT